jgi:hypothetical protein
MQKHGDENKVGPCSLSGHAVACPRDRDFVRKLSFPSFFAVFLFSLGILCVDAFDPR